MAIDLNNLNISLDEFQRISSGWYNAGEVKLKNANTLDKVNNHVATWWYDNKDEISHAETVAIKEALVKALSQSAASALKGAFIARGVASDEHMALTHTISRDNLTGTVTIVTSQPEGLKDRDNRPLNFHWTTTVALDGTVTSTPMVIEV